MKFRRVECLGEGKTGLGIEKFEDNWMICQVSKNDEIQQKVHAKIPGNIQLDLIRAKIVPDPFIARNNEQIKWIAQTEWDYETKLPIIYWIDKIKKKFNDGGILHLVFDAIDYDASFFIDNKIITRQIGMFSPVDLACGISPNHAINNETLPIKVRFHVQPWWRQHAVKSQMAFGWDFAPELRTIGIWRNVRIHFTGKSFFTQLYPFVKTLSYKEGESANVEVQIQCKIITFETETMEEVTETQSAELHITVNNIDKITVVKYKSGEDILVNLGIIEIPLWMPHSLGNQNQVPIHIKLVKNSQINDEYHGLLVNRNVEWVKNPGTMRGNDNWTLKINNKKIFIRGINWVPPDSLYGRIDAEKYKKLVDMAFDIHIDMFRVWGGGIEEKTEFYDYCTQKGMMIWQEFPFACTNYPRDPRYLKIAQNECESIVKRTRSHPSVVVYCGGNEFNPFINSHIISIVKGVVIKFAPDRKCLAASPFLGDDHNWKFWGSRKDLDAFHINGKGPFQMLTEFGMQAAPNINTLKKCYSEADSLNIQSIFEELSYHKADVKGLKYYANRFGRDFSNLNDLIQISQTLQSYALKYAIEICRSNWPNISGVFPWQLSDPWPNISWSIIDYDLIPKFAYKMLKTSYKAILPMIQYWKKSFRGGNWRTGTIIIHNASQNIFHGSILIEIKNKDPNNCKNIEIEYSKKIDVTVNSDRPLKVGAIEVDATKGKLIHLTLFNCKDEPFVRNFSYPAMEPLYSISKKFLSKLDVRFDGWWRKHMIKLMELDRIRTDVRDWNKKKNEYE